MVTVPSDRLVAALRRLDPNARALLNLSLGHGLGEDELSRLMGVPERDIARHREEALARVARALPGESAEQEQLARSLAGLSAEEWREASAPREDAELATLAEEDEDEIAPTAREEADADLAAATGPDGSAQERRDADDDAPPAGTAAELPRPAAPSRSRDRADGGGDAHAHDHSHDRGRRLRGLAALLLVGALAIAAFALIADDNPHEDGKEERSAEQGGGARPEREPEPAPPAPGPSARLRPVVAGGGASGTVTSEAGGRIAVRARGLPGAEGGGYVVWLYDSIDSAEPLGRLRGGRGEFEAGAERLREFRFLDVSLQPEGASRAVHSGQSVLRAPLSALRRR